MGATAHKSHKASVERQRTGEEEANWSLWFLRSLALIAANLHFFGDLDDLNKALGTIVMAVSFLADAIVYEIKQRRIATVTIVNAQEEKEHVDTIDMR